MDLNLFFFYQVYKINNVANEKYSFEFVAKISYTRMFFRLFVL